MSFLSKINLFIFAAVLCTTIGADSTLRFRSLRILDMTRSFFKSTDPERLGGYRHPCYRKCRKGDARVCHFNFTISQYTSMSTACGDCPVNVQDCFKKGCVPGGGHVRPLVVANLMMPGPSIQVCKGDYVEIDLDNVMMSKGVTIHWHGIWQKETPYMDGTPYLTQCPIQPHNSFKYEWFANPEGTNFWHSHVGYEEADGLYGSLIVRMPDDPLEKYYDYDLPEHVVIVWHWFPTTTGDLVRRALHLNTTQDGYSFTINGLSTKERVIRDGKSYLMPRAIFHVEEGKRHRFRLIYNTAVYCPVQVSIDNHKLLMIASDTEGFEPVEVDSFMFNAGERYDFVLHANQRPGNYWIRFRGLGLCNTENVNVSETAILRYTSSKPKEPLGSTAYEDGIRDGVLLNPAEIPTEDYSENTLLHLVNLTHIEKAPKRLSAKPDHIINLVSDMNIYSEIMSSGPYPQFNNLSFELPPINLLGQYDEITPDIICTPTDQRAKQCIGRYCTCPMVYPVKKDSLVEIVFIDVTTAFAVNHPMHLHGHAFYVVAEETVGSNISADEIKRQNELGLIPKNFEKPPGKDTIMVKAQGYSIVRFIADNPGYWFMHCHISEHVELGMGIVIKVGEDSEMIHPPPSFPKCGSWKMPDDWKPLYKKREQEGANGWGPNKPSPNWSHPSRPQPNKSHASKSVPAADELESNEPEPQNTEPNKPEPSNSEPQNTEPNKPEPSNSEPQNTEPNKPEPNNSESQNTEPNKPEPNNSESQNTEPKKPEPNNLEPQNTEPNKSEPNNSEPKNTEPNKPEPNNAEPNKPEPNNSEPNEPEANTPEVPTTASRK